MSNQDDTSGQPDSLLRRLLNQDQEPSAPENVDPPVRLNSSTPGDKRSPVTGHPAPPAETGPLQAPIRPSTTQDNRPASPPPPPTERRAAPLSPREQMQRAEEALIQLRQKMAQVAAEFAMGRLNRAQFDAIYGRYSEQRDITERLLSRNPDSHAWESVVQPGHTSFLKQHFEARVLSYAIYDQEQFELVSITGTLQLERSQLEAVLHRLKAIMRERGNPGPAQKKFNDGRCVLFVPGETTVAVAIFSLEPAAVQIQRVRDIHRDFERANQHALLTRDYQSERLVFPHRALFEEKRY